VRVDDPGKDEGVIDLVRETANGVGDLVALHLKLARRELAGELRAMGDRATGLGLFAALLVVGYALAMVGVALVIGAHAPLGTPFLIVGGGHVVLAGAGLARLTRRKRATTEVLGLTGNEAKKSLEALTHGH
jgi:hypothetical protein